jgi:uncharacterized OB-fold protein
VADNYFRNLMPTVAPDPEDRAWWEACRRRELTVPVCECCGHARIPCPPVCPGCHSPRMSLKPVSGRGRIFSFTIQYNPPAPALAELCPYNIAIIELDEMPAVHMVSNVVDAAPEELAIGRPVEVVWEAQGEGIVLPRFRLLRGA